MIRKIQEKIRSGMLRELWLEYRWMGKYARRYWKDIVFFMVTGVFTTLLSLGSSVASKYLIDAVTQYRYRQLLFMGSLIVIAGVTRIGLNAVWSRISMKINLKVNNEMLSDIYNDILSTDWEAMNRFHTGDLLNRVNGDIMTVSSSILNWMPSVIIKFVHFTGSFFILLYYDWIMGLIALLSAPVTVGLSRVFLRRMRDFNKKMREMSSKRMGFTQESFQNIMSIKAFHLNDLFSNRLDRVQQEYVDMSLDYNKFSILTSSIMSVVGLIVSCSCMGWGVYRLWTGYITYGTMTLFLQMSSTLSSDFSALVKSVPSAIAAATSAGRIMELTELPREENGNDERIQRIKEQAGYGLKIELNDVMFCYQAEKEVFHGCNFTAKSGEIVALIGESGAGKTTMMRLLLGMIRTTGGRAVIRDWNGEEEVLSAGTRQFFSYVPQENTIFSGTIADNLRMVALDATEEELVEALKVACAYEFVQQLPEGIYSTVGEKGLGLSQGQSQRLAIARAVLKKAPVILLDEATSALDMDTEKRVLENLMRAVKNGICILTTHRPAVLQICSKIYRIEHANVKEVDYSTTTFKNFSEEDFPEESETV